MTFVLLVGFVPLMILSLVAGVLYSGVRRGGPAERALGDHVRRSGMDRRSADGLPYVGADRRSGVERRAVEAARDERAA